MFDRGFRRPLPFLTVAAGCAFLAGVWSRPRLEPHLRAMYLRYEAARSDIPKPEKLLSQGVAIRAPGPRFEPGAVVAGGRLYLFGGFVNGNLQVTAHSDVFDPATEEWRRLADMPVAVTHAGIAVVGDEIWIAGGFVGHSPGPTTKTVWRYHIPSDSWTPGPMLPEARASGGLVNINGQLHYFGGLKFDRRTDSPDHWVLISAEGGKWKPRAPLLVAKNHFSVALHEGFVHLLGGQHDHDGTPIDIDDHQVYDPSTDSWRTAARLPRSRSHMEPGTFVRDGWIIAAGGRSNQIPILYDVAAYDAASDTWRTLPGLPEPIRAPVFVAIGSSLFAGLGGVSSTGVEPTTAWWKLPVRELGLPSGSSGK